MKVSELGEIGLIERISKMINDARDDSAQSWQKLIIGIGDDTAAWYGDTSIQLAKADSLIQDVHFTLKTTSWEELGWKALAINLSDIGAMGGLPCYALVSLALPDNTEVEDVTDLYKGMIELAKQFGVAIIGGDTNRAVIAVIDVTVLGSMGTKRPNLLSRSLAKPGDKIAVTGYLGGAAGGLKMLSKNLRFDTKTTTALRKAFNQPYPRVAEGQMLVKQGVKTAIDISDGLIRDLGHICQASGVGARVEIERVPICPQVKANFGGEALRMALSGGEDYELLFTAGAETIDKVKVAVSPCPVTVIGEITADKEKGITLVDKQGNPVSLSGTGWDHFRK
ncbi:MAG: thiamine-phosphate kinase [Chloroflexota bacterium]